MWWRLERVEVLIHKGRAPRVMGYGRAQMRWCIILGLRAPEMYIGPYKRTQIRDRSVRRKPKTILLQSSDTSLLAKATASVSARNPTGTTTRFSTTKCSIGCRKRGASRWSSNNSGFVLNLPESCTLAGPGLNTLRIASKTQSPVLDSMRIDRSCLFRRDCLKGRLNRRAIAPCKM